MQPTTHLILETSYRAQLESEWFRNAQMRYN